MVWYPTVRDGWMWGCCPGIKPRPSQPRLSFNNGFDNGVSGEPALAFSRGSHGVARVSYAR